MVGLYDNPDPGILNIGKEPTYMGQSILDPPSVEGWQTGTEWINSGSLLARVNFVADRVANTQLPGVQTIINQMQSDGITTPEELVNAALEHMGFVELSNETKEQLLENAQSSGNIDWSNPDSAGVRIGETLALVGATTEYQFG